MTTARHLRKHQHGHELQLPYLTTKYSCRIRQ
jgi:hypothetical protein